MSSGFTFIGDAVGPADAPLYTAAIAAGVVVVGGMCARRALERQAEPLVPDPNLNTRTLFELTAEFIIWLGDSAMGKENRRYLPFAATIFLYIFAMNMTGLVPGFVMPTDQFQINLGIALVVFTLYNYWGVREIGVVNYLKHLWGPIWWLGILLFPIELLSHSVRPVTLSARLFGNMTGDHLALAVFTDLTKVGVPVIFYVSDACLFYSAFVFTLLTMIYIRLACMHAEDH